MCLLVCHFQIGDLKGLLGLLMVNVQMLRAKLKVLDVSYGTGTGNLDCVKFQDHSFFLFTFSNFLSTTQVVFHNVL